MRALLSVGAAAWLAGCSGVDTEHDYDKAADFDILKTWAWLPTGAEDDFQQRRVRQAVEAEMARKGFVQAEERRCDFLVAARLTRSRQVDRELYPMSYGFGRFHYVDSVRVYDEGTLILDVLRASDRAVIWRGSASEAVDPDRSPAEREELVGEAVREILEPFPPGRSR